MSAVLAYFLTWTTYGTRLHGDERGSVDRFHNGVGTAFIPTSVEREDRAAFLMSGPPYLLTPKGREVVDDVIRRHCDIRKWHLRAVNVRTNHVHLVVSCPVSVSPETAMEQFKAWGTRELRAAREAGPDARVWTEHGSTRWVDSPESLNEAIDYVLNQQ